MSLLFSGLSIIFSLVLCFILILNLFGLPANWLILLIIGLWEYFWPFAPDIGFWGWFILIGLAVAGEVAELFLQIFQSRKYGSSRKSAFASIVGAILGGIILAPTFWGLGALIGALLGSFLGCYLMERLTGRSPEKALQSSLGAAIGNFLGTVVKIGFGIIIIYLSVNWLWPDPVPEPQMKPPPTMEIVYVISAKCGHNPV